MENHDTVICAEPVRGQQDGLEELEISNIAPVSPAGFGTTAVALGELGIWPAR